MSSDQKIDVLSSKASLYTGKDNGSEASLMLEMAADDDLAGFRKAIEDGARVDEPLKWYCRIIGTNKLASEQRTALMIASLYGSMNVLGFIFMEFSSSEVLVNQACGLDMVTALHCASAGGSPQAMETVKLLLEKGAHWDAKDAFNQRPVDVLVVNPMILNGKILLKGMLSGLKITAVQISDDISRRSLEKTADGVTSTAAVLSVSSSETSSPLFSPISSSEESLDGHFPLFCEGFEKERDASVADVKNIMYSSDEFRMFSFKVRPCSRAYSHDWTECPFVHPGENARRRDPRRHHYSCVPCPDFRKGSCRNGDACEYAHGVFECWLHPAQYRTRLCKDAMNCRRRVCFFAHTNDELRPLSSLEFRSMSPPLSSALSPSIIIPSPFNASLQTPPLSPSVSPFNSSYGSAWSYPGIPGGGFHTSRLKASLHARGLPPVDFNPISDLDDAMSDFSSLCNYENINVFGSRADNIGGGLGNTGCSISPTVNLQSLFASEMPREVDHYYNSSLDHQNLSPHAFQSHSHSLASLPSTQRLSQLQGFPICQSLLKPVEQMALQRLSSLKQLSPCRVDLNTLGTASQDIAASLQNNKAVFFPGDHGHWSSNDLDELITSTIMSDWGSPSGKPDWGFHGSDLSKLRKSISFASIGSSHLDAFSSHRGSHS